MNSAPSWRAGHTLAAKAAKARIIVSHLAFRTPLMMGRYSQISKRFTGFLCSGTMRPRTNNTISAGTTVIESMAAAAIAKLLV